MATYTVQRGDTLSAIAKKYGTTTTKLMELNPIIKNANVIQEGWVLTITGEVNTVPVNQTYIAKVELGLQSNTTRTMMATWTWDQPHTKHFEIRWWCTYEGHNDRPDLVSETTVSSITRMSRWTAPDNAYRVWVHVRPIAETKEKINDVEIPWWTAQWSTYIEYAFKNNPPEKPSVPNVTIDKYKLTAELTNLNLNADSIVFEVYRQGELALYDVSPKCSIVNGYASYVFDIDPDSKYIVRACAYRGTSQGQWSEFSGSQTTIPSSSSGITTLQAKSKTSVYIAWASSPTATSYDIEYTTKSEYFDSSDQTSTIGGIATTSYTKTGLESGQEYFFRVRAVNDSGASGWSSAKSIILGTKPSAPTTWSSTTTAIVGEPLTLNWVHNSEDGSSQVSAVLEITVDGVTTSHTIQNTTDEEEKDKTSTYELNTSAYVEGAKVQWRVKTCGITGEYSDWSILRKIDIYAKPTLQLNMLDIAGSDISVLTTFPFTVSGKAGPKTQKVLSYHISIVANESYETTNYIGNKTTVSAGETVYSKHFDISEDLSVILSAGDVDLENNISYTLNGVVAMDSGLTGESSVTFRVGWTEIAYQPNAEVGINTDDYSAFIHPYCRDIDGTVIEGVTLAVYRRNYDGTFTEIAKGLDNVKNTYVTDPHPALDYARYRIVATTNNTGAVSYYDLPAIPVGGKAIIIQWDETWSNFDAYEGMPSVQHNWSGSMLKLPYNIDVSDTHKPDVEMIEYIGRSHPVSYYGTHLGISSTWNTVIDATDVETLYTIRRLARWLGDVYVREPSGSGYWANITVAFNQKHRTVTIPVTFNITRVEGGI